MMIRKTPNTISRRKEDKSSSSEVPNLPQGIISDILSLESACFLQDVGRLVCKSWATLISEPQFIEKNLSHPKPIFFIFKDLMALESHFCMELIMKGEKLEPRTLDIHKKVCGRLVDSFAGLMLYVGRYDIFLVNPIIDKISKIPYSPIFRAPRSRLNVSYLPITKEVKVFCHRTDIVIGEKNKFLWSVFTVGRDTSWRTYDVNHNFEIDLSFQDWIESFSMGGLIFHWFMWKGSFYCKKKFVVIDVADESFHVVDTPADPFLHLIPMEKQLFLISMRRQLPPAGEEDGIRIWKMRDFRRSEWEEVLRIEEVDDELRSVLIEKFRVGLAWLEDHKILVFLSSQWKMMVYDFKSKECYYIPQPPTYSNIHPDLFHHTSSLVSW